MKDFFSGIKYKILICLLVFLAGMMAYAGANNRLTTAPQEIIGLLLTPVQRFAAFMSSGAENLSDRYLHIDEVMAENERLKAQNTQLRQELLEYDKMKAENEAFKSLLEIEEKKPEYTYRLAFVIGRDSLEQFGGFTIDIGSSDGVEKGDTVVSETNQLVGVVVEVNLTSSKVLTVLSPSFNAAGAISRTRENGILTGSAEYASEGRCIFTNLSRDTLATSGDEVITTGLGEVYPPDISIGTIEQLIPEASGKTTTAIIAPGEDISTIKQVFVITDTGEAGDFDPFDFGDLETDPDEAANPENTENTENAQG